MEGNRFNQLPIAAAYGDVACIPSSIEYSSTSAGEVTDFADLPAGAEIVDVMVRNDALGASTTMAYGLRYPDSDTAADNDAFLAAADSSSAERRETTAHPVKLTERAIVTGTLAGGAATGKVTVTVYYRFQGTL